MKTVVKILLVFSVLAIFAVAFRVGYRQYINYEREQSIAAEMQKTKPPTSAPSTTVTAPPTTAKPKLSKIDIPAEFINYTAENNAGSPVGSTTDLPDLTNSVFIGDSVSLGFARYCAQKGIMQETVFLTAGSYAVHHALNSSVSEGKGFKHPMYKGKELPVKEAIKELSPSNVYFCLGINDIAGFGVGGTVKNYCKLINSVWEINPDTHIYIVSTTFLVEEAQKTNLNNLNLANLNHNMKAICEEYENLDYIDIMSSLQSESFSLSPNYCSDAYIHQNNSAYSVWEKMLNREGE